MINATYQQLALDWHPKSKTDRSFILLLAFILVLTMGFAMLMASIEVPAETKRQKIVIPERVAKFILDKPKPKPKPIIKQKPKPKPIKKEIPKPKKEVVKPKEKIKVKKQPPKKERVLTAKQVKARDTASKSGLLALSSELADLMDTSDIDGMVGTKLAKGNGGTDALLLASNNNSDVLSVGTTKGSGGVSGRNVGSGGTSSTVQLNKSAVANAQQALLASRADEKIVNSVHKADKSSKKKAKRTGNYRPEEDIAYVMDKNKSKLHALYRKARRTNPSIKGKIVLEITISPAGKVLKVHIASSELDDDKLERRIVSRVKKFNFGVDNVKAVTVTYPIEFLPS
ncbi:AgmX/PglI C-terminal domain-containing protein [Psychromonas sp. Urea-02u-13]|uniref:AgmX/PglI C-terminal domain-containing protein n=1 Tax=Psychromonas sp. Urea-02u-13 TaxID=2058326 RepID=UPI000C33B9BB|nr:AgmX/PglI C-terminal domain-containing protein [Psychromonas sp. Urea-02u-13]PKG38783.1 energy transducer TonB [Psychromonas sp. Urea-02u-13]